MAQKYKTRAIRALKRRRRVRGRINGTAEVPRLTVARSLKNIYAQIIDDASQATLVGVGTESKVLNGKLESGDNKTKQAFKVGEAIAELAMEKGIKKVVFDRNRYRYIGRVRAVAEGARKKGLEI